MTYIYRICIFFTVALLSITTTLHGTESEHQPAHVTTFNRDIDVSNIDKEALDQLSEDEKQWYLKFQNGLMFFDGWQQISTDILSCLVDEDHENAKLLLGTIGVKIGTEWCRDNDVRRIDTDQLRSWGKRLKQIRQENPSELMDTLKIIANEVDALLIED